MTPRLRIAAGIVFLVAGFVVGLLDALTPLTTLQAFVIAQSITWVLVVIALVLLVFRQSEAPIATGVTLLAIAPLVWILLMLTPIKGVFILPFLVAGMIAVYGIFVALYGLADRRPEAAQ